MFKQDIEGLNKHREQTIRDIKDLLQDNKRVACVRYTGYGKSYYIVRKLIEDVSGKVIIVVPNDTLKIHYEEQYKDNDKVIILTYQVIKNKTTDFIQQNYRDVSLIIADECHHITATKWTKEFQRLEKETNASILGLTATPEKIKDKSVVDTFFNGVQVEPLNLLDGISLGFVPKIKYVVAYASLDGKQDIIDNKMSEIDRYKISNLLKVENIIGKYITDDYLKDNLKILVFVSRIEYIEEAKVKVYDWFNTLYENKIINIYSISSSKSVNHNKNELYNFGYNTAVNSIDIMISVDKLIEGLHLPFVSIAIALRKTKSTRVYFQQLGRIINDKQPIFFDLINNSSHLYQIKKEYELNINKTKWNKYNNRDKIMFDGCIELIDKTMDIDNIIYKYINRSAYQKHLEYIKIIEANIDYIEKNPDNLSIKDMCLKLDIDRSMFRNYLTELGINFKSCVDNYYDSINNVIVQNREYIESNPDNLSVKQLALKFNMDRATFQKHTRELGIKIKLSFKYNSGLIFYKDYIEINPDNLTIEELAGRFNISNISWFRERCRNCGIKLPMKLNVKYTEKYSKQKYLILEENKDYLISNWYDLTFKEIQNKYNVSNKNICDFADKYNLMKSHRKSRKIRESILKDKKVIEANIQGLTFQSLAKKYGLSGSALKYILTDLNFDLSNFKTKNIEEFNRIKLFLDSKRTYIEKNPDNLSMNQMSKKLNVSNNIFYHWCKKNNLNTSKIFSSIKDNKITSKNYAQIILNNKEYIEKNPDNLTKTEMVKKLNLGGVPSFNLHCSRLNLNIGHAYKNIYENKVLANKKYIEANPDNLNLRDFSKKLNMDSSVFKKYCKKLNIHFRYMNNDKLIEL